MDASGVIVPTGIIRIRRMAAAVLLDLEGPGVLRRIWITVSSRDPHYLRGLAIRMYWDGEEEPSVSVPPEDGRSGRRASVGPISMTGSIARLRDFRPMYRSGFSTFPVAP